MDLKINPQSGLTSTLNKIVRNIEQNTIQTSKDLKVSRSSAGSIVSVNPAFKNQPNSYTQYRGEYSTITAYTVNDIVRVMHDTVYTASVHGATIPTVPGVWLCVCDIPDNTLSTTLKSKGYTTPYWVRDTDIKYYPQFPEPSTIATTAVPNGRYWDLISLLPVTSTTCVDGTDTTTYLDSYVSS